MHRIFVYGTLRRGEYAHDLISRSSQSQFLGEHKTSHKYHLYDQGSFPGIAINETMEGGVFGEVFEVDDACLRDLDRYEGVAEGLFKRAVIELEDGSEALAYLIVRPNYSGKVVSGRWNRGSA